MPETVIVRREDVTLDRLVWDRFGRTEGLVEATLALNPGLAALGPVLPVLTPVRLPDAATDAVPVRTVVRLWN